MPSDSLEAQAGEVIRFLAVGMASILLNTAIIVALTEIFGIHYLISYAICFVLVTLFGFNFNRKWSFGISGSARRSELLRYYTTSIAATVISMATSLLIVRIGVPYSIAVFISAGAVTPFNFIVHRRWSFDREIIL